MLGVSACCCGADAYVCRVDTHVDARQSSLRP